MYIQYTNQLQELKLLQNIESKIFYSCSNLFVNNFPNLNKYCFFQNSNVAIESNRKVKTRMITKQSKNMYLLIIIN